MQKRGLRALGSLCLGLSALCWFFYFAQYHRWRDCFDEAGRCFDAASGSVYLQQAGIAWLTLACLTLGGAVCVGWVLVKTK